MVSLEELKQSIDVLSKYCSSRLCAECMLEGVCDDLGIIVTDFTDMAGECIKISIRGNK